MKSLSAAFLFGSGISLASKAPTVQRITKAILTEKWTKHTTGVFVPRRENEIFNPGEGTSDQVQDFLKIVHETIADHLLAREGRPTNYEDLFSAAIQIFEDEIAEITNPLLAESIASIRRSSAYLHSRYSDAQGGNRFATLAKDSTDLIQSVVCQQLSSGIERKELDLISAASQSLGHVDIFTLNHDLLVEEELDNAKIGFTDGFGKKDGGIRQFSWEWNRSRSTVHLFKLHGSINWHLCRKGNVDVACRIDRNFESCRDGEGKLVRTLTTTPLFLTGTMVKERSYGHSLFGELFREFHDVLAKHRTLICCGYGWSDKGINTRIDQWLRDAPENRLVILHGKGGEPLEAKSFWVTRWQKYRKAKKVVLVPKWLSGVTLKELLPFVTDQLAK
jgi:hypothetical protein